MPVRTPDFENNLLKILKCQKPHRPTLFEFAINQSFKEKLCGHGAPSDDALGQLRLTVDAMAAAGYDYASTHASSFAFRPKIREVMKTKSMNGQALIYDRESFEKFEWPDADRFDCSAIERIAPYLPEGMKLMIAGPGGVLENVMDLVGYDNLCIMLFEEPDLVGEIFDRVGSETYKYYKNIIDMDTVGFICSNDDWGFNTQTFLSPDDLRKYVFPWHKKYVELAHSHNKPCILHSCGYFKDVIDDVINDMKYDARHSYEDNITPVEEAYDMLKGKIAVLGGIDINFLSVSTPDEVYNRCRAMIERTRDGGYALGSGNSVADYIPYENYLAMCRAALEG